MARIKNWNPDRYDPLLAGLSMDKLRAYAHIIADFARQGCPVGTITRPPYKSGKYAGKSWTARTPGSLRRSIRVVEKYPSKYGALILEETNVRVYAGNRDVYYAAIVEYAHPTQKGFMRKALDKGKAAIRGMLSKGMAA